MYKERSCQILPTCVSETDGASVPFALHAALSAILNTNKNRKAWKDQNISPSAVRQVYTMMAKSLEKHKVKLVDYMSLDVEGHELQVLKAIDWNKVIISVMTVDLTPDTLTLIQTFLESKRYVRHFPEGEQNGKLYEDAVFLNKKAEWGRPK